MLTQAQLKELLHYDPETGLFRWLISNENGVHIGDIAGTENKGYIRIGIQYKMYMAHRLAWLYMFNDWPQNQIDHINRNRSDNRLINLRIVTGKQNQWNRSPQKNKQGYTGVSVYRKKYRAKIRVDGKKIHIGSFDTAEKASQAYLAAKAIYHVI